MQKTTVMQNPPYCFPIGTSPCVRGTTGVQGYNRHSRGLNTHIMFGAGEGVDHPRNGEHLGPYQKAHTKETGVLHFHARLRQYTFVPINRGELGTHVVVQSDQNMVELM
mmetsp:Transcript_1720/g.3365  ORF Transcript_1720/g.3365 Transcript_1720/m.3365 type:complete len:109 (+) Transcript_1720:124-450(+)